MTDTYSKAVIPGKSFNSKNTDAIFVATPYLTTTVSIPLVSVDNSPMHISNSLKTQRNNWVTP